jgi:orotate phosphoribosyltransferase
MQAYQKEFIEFSLALGVLKFGQFTLKSGRRSPYFFNAGLFNSGASLARLGRCYAETIRASGVPFDMLYGPAYKGIPLASATAIALAHDQDRDIPFCFNRKEVKDHGEGGSTFGAPLQGRVVIVDDVISAGTSVNESVDIIRSAGANPVGVVIALDRMERGQGVRSAVQEVQAQHGLSVHSIINLDLLVEHLEQAEAAASDLARIREYRAQYGV